jgi:hypothetical protein
MVSWFLQTHLDSFIVTRQLSSTYRDLVPQDSFTVTPDFSAICRDLQKPFHHAADGNSPNRRAVSIHWLEKRHLDNNVMTPAFLFTMTNEC